MHSETKCATAETSSDWNSLRRSFICARCGYFCRTASVAVHLNSRWCSVSTVAVPSLPLSTQDVGGGSGFRAAHLA